jgi:hypothetical protein
VLAKSVVRAPDCGRRFQIAFSILGMIAEIVLRRDSLEQHSRHRRLVHLAAERAP